MSGDQKILIEIAYGTSASQSLETLTIDVGVSCAGAIAKSGICEKFAEDNLPALPIAIWGRPVSPDTCPQSGDRIEILRPLEIDPRDARRLLAESGKFMGGSGRDDKSD